MASVASVAVKLYEFCSFLFFPPFPRRVWEAEPQSKVFCLMYGLPSTAVHNLFKMCLEWVDGANWTANKDIHQSWLCASPCRSLCRNPCWITNITLEPMPGTSLFFTNHPHLLTHSLRHKPVCFEMMVMVEFSNDFNISKVWSYSLVHGAWKCFGPHVIEAIFCVFFWKELWHLLWFQLRLFFDPSNHLPFLSCSIIIFSVCLSHPLSYVMFLHLIPVSATV